MVTKRAPESVSKLRFKKETIQDLDVSRKVSLVKGRTGTIVGATTIVPVRRFDDPVLIPQAPIRQR